MARRQVARRAVHAAKRQAVSRKAKKVRDLHVGRHAANERTVNAPKRW